MSTKPVRIVRVFIASPSELAEERGRLTEVVEELNLLWGNTLGLRLELVKWETHAHPGVGTEPQAVVDEHVGDDYEIFIGVLWTRFGTPTSDAASGTEHEFQRAYSRYKKQPEQLSIMFYFKDAQVAPSQVDVEQLLKVAQFKKRLPELGSLYWTYKTPEEFVNLVRVHLTRELQSRRNRAPVPQPSVIVQPEHPESELEPGFFDLLEIVADSSKTMNDLTGQMGRAVEQLGQKLAQRTTDVNKAHNMDESSRLRYLKRVADGAAEDMQDYCRDTEPKIPELGRLYSQTTRALARAVSMSQEFGGDKPEEIVALVEGMSTFVRVITGTRNTIQAFRETIRRSPRTTSAYIAAQKRTVIVLSTLDSEYEGMQEHTRELLNSLQPPIGGSLPSAAVTNL